MRKRPIRKEGTYILFLFLSIVFVFLVFDPSTFSLPFINGDDYVFHFYRIKSMTNDLKNTGHMCYLSAFGHGDVLYGVNLFYPFVTTVLPIAFLNVFFHSIILSINVFLVILNFVTLIIAYQTTVYFFRQAKPQLGLQDVHFRSVTFSILYTFSSYRLVTIYTRFALGEMVAMTFLPLIFVGFYDILLQKGKKKNWLVWGMTGLAYTHLLSLELATVILFLLFFIAFPVWTIPKIKQLFLSGLLFIGLSAASVFVTFEQLAHMKLRSVDEYPLAENAKSVTEMIKEGLQNNLSSYSLGTWVIVILLLGIVVLLGSWLRKKPSKQLFFLFSIGAGLFLVSSQWFPWNVIQNTPLKFMQFQFRLFPYVTYFLLLFGVELLFTFVTNRQKMAGGIVIVFTIFFAGLSIDQLKTSRETQKMIVPAISYSDEDAQSTHLYRIYYNLDYIADIPEKDYMLIFGKQGKVSGKEVPMDYRTYGGQTTLQVKTTENDEKVALPIIAYKGVSVYEHGKELQTQITASGTVSVQLPKGNHILSIHFKPPIGMILGYGLTMITCVGYVVSFYRNRKKISRQAH